MHKIAICLTTFMRNELLIDTVDSIIKYFPENSVLYIADQGNKSQVKDRYFSYLTSKTGRVFYFNLPYDCGLSYARNYLVDVAKHAGIDYCLITADSLRFINKLNLEPIVNGMEKNVDALVGFEIKDRIPWEWNIELVPEKHFWLSKISPDAIIQHEGFIIKRVELCRNFFLAKTEALLDVKWDNDLKLAEHEDFFYRLKLKGYKCIWTNIVSAEYIEDKPEEYRKMRDRMYNHFQYIMLKKYNIKQWMKYEI